MKTRIISGAVFVAVIAGVLFLGLTVNSLFLTGFLSVCAAIAVYELLYTAAGIKSKAAIALSGVAAVAFIALKSGELSKYCSCLEGADRVVLTVFFVFAALIILVKHNEFDFGKIVCFAAMPYFLAAAFSCLAGILSHKDGVYYLLLLMNFSAVCDTGAYFTGVTCGKHKLCPNISPKKTWEGAIGGVVSSVLVSLVLLFCFGKTSNLPATLILTVPLCVVGMMGDLFASIIKRKVGIKDYGKLIPGHGGILDRFDSILMLAPVVYIFVSYGVI